MGDAPVISQPGYIATGGQQYWGFLQYQMTYLKNLSNSLLVQGGFTASCLNQFALNTNHAYHNPEQTLLSVHCQKLQGREFPGQLPKKPLKNSVIKTLLRFTNKARSGGKKNQTNISLNRFKGVQPLILYYRDKTEQRKQCVCEIYQGLK